MTRNQKQRKVPQSTEDGRLAKQNTLVDGCNLKGPVQINNDQHFADDEEQEDNDNYNENIIDGHNSFIDNADVVDDEESDYSNEEDYHYELEETIAANREEEYGGYNSDGADESAEENGEEDNVLPANHEFAFNDIAENLGDRIDFILKLFNSNNESLPKDFNELCMESLAGVKTKGELSTALHSLQANKKVNDSLMLEFLLLFKRVVPSLNLPIRHIPSTGNQVLDIETYIKRDVRSIKIDVCQNGCIAYEGEHYTAIACPECESMRYSPCTIPTHRGGRCGESAKLCDPTLSGHAASNRTSSANFIYKPMITLLQDLVKWSVVNESDVYKYKPPPPGRDGEMSDIWHSPRVQEAMSLMDAREDKDPEVLNWKFLMTMFFDGGSLDDKRDGLSINPMIVTILNCCPSDRGKNGIGLWVIAMHLFKNGTNAEKYMMDLFAAEQLELQKGISFDFAITTADNAIKTVRVFLQAHIIVHIYDTVALCKTVGLQGPNSFAGCMLCGNQRGQGRKKLKLINRNVINIGARTNLENDNPLRYMGISGQCCPHGYYYGSTQSINQLLDKVNNTTFPIKHSEETKRAVPKLNKREFSCDDTYYETENNPNRKTNDDDIIIQPTILIDVEEKLNRKYLQPRIKLENEKYELNDFIKFLYYAHCDFRKATESGYRNTSEFFKNAANVKDSGVNFLYTFEQLIFGKIEKAVIYDPFHAFKNLLENIVSWLTGVSGSDFGSIRQSALEGRFPMMRQTPSDNQAEKKKDKSRRSKSAAKEDKEDKDANSVFKRDIPYVLSRKQQRRADSFHNCINIPRGELRKDFKSLNPLTSSSALKGHCAIQYLTTFLSFSLSFTDLPKEYKNLMSLVAELISDIISPILQKYEVNKGVDENGTSLNAPSIIQLCKRTVEMLSLLEGMFNDSCIQFTTHQILDIVHSMMEFGPVRSWWAFAGERFMKCIKGCCPNGGMNPLHTINDYHSNSENIKLSLYQVDKSFLDNQGNFSDNRIAMCGEPDKVLLSKWQIDQYMESLYHYLECSENDEAIRISPFYRLYKAYNVCKRVIPISRINANKYRRKNCDSYADFSFIKWLSYLVRCKYSDVTILDGVIDEGVNHPRLVGNNLASMYSDNQRRICIFEQDQAFAQHLVDVVKKPLIIFCTATVLGLSFDGRGKECSETEKPFSVSRVGAQHSFSIPHNKRNDTYDKWAEDLKFNSWAKVKLWYINNRERTRIRCQNRYVQYNWFTRVNLPGDGILDGLPFANVTARVTQYQRPNDKVKFPFIHVFNERQCANKLNEIKEAYDQVTFNAPVVGEGFSVEAEGGRGKRRHKPKEVISAKDKHFIGAIADSSYDSTLQFICLNYAQSTNVAVCGATLNDELPILVDSRRNHSRKQKHTTDTALIDRLYFIDLHPHRRHVYISENDSKLKET